MEERKPHIHLPMVLGLLVVASCTTTETRPHYVCRWDALTIGMTRSEVIDLLGEPTEKRLPSKVVHDSSGSIGGAVAAAALAAFFFGPPNTTETWYYYQPDDSDLQAGALLDRLMNMSEEELTEWLENRSEAEEEQAGQLFARLIRPEKPERAFCVHFGEDGLVSAAYAPDHQDLTSPDGPRKDR